MDIWNKYERDLLKLDEYYKKLKGTSDFKKLDNLYEFMKTISIDYYQDGEILSEYNLIKKRFILIEKDMKKSKLFDYYMNFKELDKDYFMDYLVYRVRKKILIEKYLYIDDEEIDTIIYNELNLTNYCGVCSSLIKKICDKNNIESYIITIYPGYDKNALLYDGNGYHCANCVKYDNNYYLVDVTYSQFFDNFRNHLNRIGIMGTGGCHPGVFMLMSSKGRDIASKLISDGYIIFDEEVLKTYLDAFTISFRNGLYYEETNDYSFTTNYSYNDYIKFLNGEDSQLNYEDKIHLGYQCKPNKKIYKFRNN